MKVAFIGAGVMGEAIIKGLLAHKIVAAGEIVACDIKESRLNEVITKYKIKGVAGRREAVGGADIIVIAVKPQDINDVVVELKTRVPPEATVISIAAGVTLGTLRGGLEHPYIVRVMPNTPAQIGEGISVWTATGEVSAGQKEKVSAILAALGKEVYVSSEDYVDMATALSASGVGFVFLIIEALTDAGVHIGLPRPLAERLTLETMAGAAHMVQATGKHPAELKNQVTSPAGTTTDGLHRLEAGGFRHLLIDAVNAAYKKAKSLGDKA